MLPEILAIQYFISGDVEFGTHVAVRLRAERANHGDWLVLVNLVHGRVPEAHVLQH